MEKANFARRIAEGGLLVSLAFIFYFIGFTFTVVDIIRYVSITPIVIGVVKYGVNQGLQITLASTFLVGILLSLLSGLEFFLSIGLIGLVLGICLKRNYKTFNTIFLTFIVTLIGFALVLLMYVFFLNLSLTIEFQSISEWLSSTLSWLCEWSVIDGFVNSITEVFNLNKSWTSLNWVTDLFMDTLPTLLIFVAFYYSIYIWVFNVFLLKRLKIPLHDNALIGEFSIFLIIPPWTLLFMLAGIVSLVIDSYFHIRILDILGVNLIAIMSIVSFSKGVFAINTFLRDLIPAGRNIKLILSLMITLLEFTILMPLVVLFGLFAIGGRIQNSELYQFLGNTYLRSGKFDQAIKYYKMVLQLKPDKAVCHKLLGIAYQHKGSKDLAVKHIKRALELAGDKSGIVIKKA